MSQPNEPDSEPTDDEVKELNDFGKTLREATGGTAGPEPETPTGAASEDLRPEFVQRIDDAIQAAVDAGDLVPRAESDRRVEEALEERAKADRVAADLHEIGIKLRIANAVADAVREERERCAKIARSHAAVYLDHKSHARAALLGLDAAIRAHRRGTMSGTGPDYTPEQLEQFRKKFDTPASEPPDRTLDVEVVTAEGAIMTISGCPITATAFNCIRKLARAGMVTHAESDRRVEEAVRDETERCAKVCEAHFRGDPEPYKTIAAAIRGADTEGDG